MTCIFVRGGLSAKKKKRVRVFCTCALSRKEACKQRGGGWELPSTIIKVSKGPVGAFCCDFWFPTDCCLFRKSVLSGAKKNTRQKAKYRLTTLCRCLGRCMWSKVSILTQWDEVGDGWSDWDIAGVVGIDNTRKFVLINYRWQMFCLNVENPSTVHQPSINGPSTVHLSSINRPSKDIIDSTKMVS